MSFRRDTRIKKARKIHICDCCGSGIGLGESYLRACGKNDENVFFTLILCPTCDKIIDWYCEVEGTCNISTVLEDCYSDDFVYENLKKIKHPSNLVCKLIKRYEMRKGCIITDLENLHVDYIMKMNKYDCLNPNYYKNPANNDKYYKRYKRAWEQLDNLLMNISKHPDILERLL